MRRVWGKIKEFLFETIIDALVKSQDGKVKSSKFKARKS